MTDHDQGGRAGLLSQTIGQEAAGIHPGGEPAQLTYRIKDVVEPLSFSADHRPMLEDLDGVPLHLGPDEALQHLALDQIDGRAQQVLGLLLDPDEVEQREVGIWRDVDRQIDVAIKTSVSARDRA